MKRYLAILAAVLTLCGAATAQMRTAYFMEGSYFRTDMNPALAPTRGYIALPGIGSVGLNINNNFLSVDNMLYKRNGEVVTFLNEQVSTADFMKKMPNVCSLGLNADINILSFGAHTKKMFWSFGLRARSQSDASFSSNLFSTIKSLGNGRHDLSGASINSLNYMEASLGFAIPIKEIATFGFRVKGLLGIMHAQAKLDNAFVNLDASSITGQVRGNLRAGGMLFRSNYPTGKQDINQILIPAFWDEMEGADALSQILKNIRSGGAAIDLGAEVRLFDDHLRISAAVTDLGFIYWAKNTVATGEAVADFYYNGFNLSSGEADADGSFDTMLTDPGAKGYSTRLNCTINAGIEYNILNNHIAFGLLSHTEFRPSTILTELTASVNFRIGRWLTTTFSHTFLNRNRPGIFGFALNVHPAAFNLFLGADFIGTQFAKFDTIPVPQYMKSVNVYMGIGFNLGKAKYMASMQPKEKKSKK